MSRRKSGFGCGALAVVAALMVVLASAYTQRDALTGKAWNVTYRATGSKTEPMSVTYQDTKSRYLWGDRSLKEHAAKNVRTGWSREVTLAAGRQAKITVTPAPGATAHCQILLDGEEPLAKSSSPAPGQPAVCIADLKGSKNLWE
ncbi:hypothetical protein [Streptomyces sp. x-80]|uniref:hypothetical protein n=1 Tax=Streptomyces sp. x-80 TaxID=2789282 RepID=UPI00398038E4